MPSKIKGIQSIRLDTSRPEDGVLHIRPGARVKHAEQLTTKENPGYHPWNVILNIAMYPGDSGSRKWSVFLRAPSPGAAAKAADLFWRRFERDKFGIPKNSEYPDTDGEQEVYNLDEGEFLSEWRLAKRLPRPAEVVFQGDPRLPSVFCIYRDGYKCPALYADMISERTALQQEMESIKLWVPSSGKWKKA